MRIKADWLTAPMPVAVLAMLNEAGHQAYFVGGCVRNALLDAGATDIDIATDAHPQRVIDLAKRAEIKALPTGTEHGTVTLIQDDFPVEVTTFRKDVETDGRRAVVAFATTMEEDARRRDFTINALYADSTGTVHDPLGGLADIKARRVRFIEDASQRIAEDYLRSLRFFRFHAWYGDPDAGLDAEALAAISAHLDGLDLLSNERVGAEIRKLLAAPDPTQALASMAQTGVLARILPGAETIAIGPLVMFEAQLGLRPDWYRRLAALGREDYTQHLRLSRKETRTIAALHQGVESGEPATVLGYRLGEDAGVSAALIRAASLSMPPELNLMKEIKRGATASFPITAKDLSPEFKDKALGDELKRLEENWIASDFAATKSELLS